jgi:transposase
MSKYSTKIKLEVVKYYLQEHPGYTLTSEKFNVPRSLVVRWVRKYKENGYEGLIKNQKTSYSGDFKQSVVEYMNTNHLSCQEVAIHFNLAGDYVVSKWERIYYEEGPQGLYIERRGRSKNMSSKPKKKKLSKEIEEDLITENQRLRMENEYLKKLNALVQERIKRENKKK